MKHQISPDDREFKSQVENCSFPIPQFNHEAHVRLAYIYLVENEVTDRATSFMRNSLKNLLLHAGVDPETKYHETMTEAWILAVNHFMHHSEQSNSANEFIGQNPDLLNSKIIQSHYSTKLLFSEQARREFVEPDISQIPRHSSAAGT